jgi:hypothetical protein
MFSIGRDKDQQAAGGGGGGNTIEVGGDYSTDEQPVMVLDPSNMQTRQKLWIDGKPIYRRVFTGNITRQAGVSKEELIYFAYSLVLNVSGWWAYASNGKTNFTVSSSLNTTGNDYEATVLSTNDSFINLRTWTVNAGSNLPYQLIVEYTK